MMHAGERDIDTALVKRLLAGQFPQWAALPVTPVASAGTDNALFRLGSDKVVRLPRIHWAVDQVENEWQWLPRLAPHLPLTVPLPLALGQAADGYPWPWSVYPWIEGENAMIDRMADPLQAARDLAGFIHALRGIDTTGAPPASERDRGGPLAPRDAGVRAALDDLRQLAAQGIELIDIEAAAVAWATALSAPPYLEQPVWLHGDLQSGNLLAINGRLHAVIDFGCLAVGDPACDLQPAWNLFDSASRAAFRDALEVDDVMWARGRGWALSVALIALPYYHVTNPVLAGISQRAIAEVLAEL